MQSLCRAALPVALAIIVTLAVSSSFARDASGRVLVRVNAVTTVRNDHLTLGEIAEIEARDPATVEQLRLISLGYAPNVGAVRELAREKIVLAIISAGFAADAVEVRAPAAAIIRRAAQTVDPALVREAVERATLSELTATGATARLSRLDLPPRIEAPSGTVEVRASAGGVRNIFAPFSVGIEIWVDGRVARRLNATAQVEAFAPVMVASRDLAANSRLRREDARIEVRRLERAPSFYVQDAERLRGTSPRLALAQGEPLQTDALVSEIIVNPGDPVRIVGESGGLSILVAGEARASGRVGDHIQVKNLQSGLLLQATIIDEGLVRVRF